MPLFEGFQMSFTNGVQSLVSSKGFKAFTSSVHSITEAIGSFASTGAGLGLVLAGWGAMKALTWWANGKMLARGFNSKVNLGGSSSSSSSSGSGSSGSSY